MMCEACERNEHWNCGMQTWCSCDCEGPDGEYPIFETYDWILAPLPEPPEGEG